MGSGILRVLDSVYNGNNNGPCNKVKQLGGDKN